MASILNRRIAALESAKARAATDNGIIVVFKHKDGLMTCNDNPITENDLIGKRVVLVEFVSVELLP